MAHEQKQHRSLATQQKSSGENRNVKCAAKDYSGNRRQVRRTYHHIPWTHTTNEQSPRLNQTANPKYGTYQIDGKSGLSKRWNSLGAPVWGKLTRLAPPAAAAQMPIVPAPQQTSNTMTSSPSSRFCTGGGDGGGGEGDRTNRVLTPRRQQTDDYYGQNLRGEKERHH